MAKPSYFYGIHAVQSILQHRGIDGLTSLFKTVKQDDATVANITELAQTYGIAIQISAKDKLTKLAESPQHQGVVLQARPVELKMKQISNNFVDKHQSRGENRYYYWCQSSNPNNLGACLRTAVAMGVSAVIIPKNHSSSITPAVAKVAVGAVELISFIKSLKSCAYAH